MNKIVLSGHSGCKIILIEDKKNKRFIKKISSNSNYNERLKSQCLKQINFNSKYIFTPKVMKYGINSEGLFYFDMEYISGITLSEYMKTISVNKIQNIANIIIKHYLIENINIQQKDNQVQNIFLNKIMDTASKLKVENKNIKEAICLLKKYEYYDFEKSFCHGDLTLENIIIANNRIYYIDFLDSFYDSWLLDVAKLLQDTQTFWSYRNDNKLNENLLIRLMIFRDIILSELKSLNENYIRDSYYALLLNILRIYPYTFDIKTLNFLNYELNNVIKIIRRFN